MPSIAEKRSPRLAYLDALRLLACFLVIVNHTAYLSNFEEAGLLSRLLGFGYVFLCKSAVPVFLMISGRTLLARDDTPKRSAQRVLRIGAVIVIFSLCYEVFYAVRGEIQNPGVKQFLIDMYERQLTGSFWYLYTYAALLLTLPLLQRLVRVMSRGHFLYFFAVSAFFLGLMPMVAEYTRLSPYSADFMLPFFDSYVCYLLMGCYMGRREGRKTDMPLFAAGLVLALVFSALMTERSYQSTPWDYMYLDNIVLFPTVVIAACLFGLFRRIRFSEGVGRIVSLLGSATFGAYLLSDLVIAVTEPAYLALAPSLPALPGVIGYELIVFIVCLAGGLVLKRLPGFSKLL